MEQQLYGRADPGGRDAGVGGIDGGADQGIETGTGVGDRVWDRTVAVSRSAGMPGVCGSGLFAGSDWLLERATERDGVAAGAGGSEAGGRIGSRGGQLRRGSAQLGDPVLSERRLPGASNDRSSEGSRSWRKDIHRG